MCARLVCGPAGAALIFLMSGCANFVETETIEAFSRALRQDDLDNLRQHTSTHFEQKALRLAESLDDLRILRLPDETTTVVDVEDVSKHEKKVRVQVGNSSRRLLYRLVHDTERDAWLVDDIFMNQKKQGVHVTKSVTEQMDLLLTVREFLATWNNGGRDDVLAVTTPGFGRILAGVPPVHLATLTRKVAGEHSPDSKYRPEAQLDEGFAIVRLPRNTGRLTISLRLKAGAWQVDDVALESQDEDAHIASLRRHAGLVTAATAFMDAFSSDDKTRLRALCTNKLYRNSVVPGDLSTIRLPDLSVTREDVKFRIQGSRGSVVAPTGAALVKVDLVWQDNAETAAPDGFLVHEVTLYDYDGSQQKRLSAIFTAQARMLLFDKALREGDIDRLRHLSTPVFSKQVWDRVDPTLLSLLPIRSITDGAPRLVDTVFRGDVTELIVENNGQLVRYIMRDWNGDLGVDDILLEQEGLPQSVRQRCQLTLPIHRFTTALAADDIDAIQRSCSADFDRLVWSRTRRVPDIRFSLLSHLAEPLTRIETSPDFAQVRFGNETWGATVRVVKQFEEWAVDDVTLIAGPEASQRVHLKNAMQQKLALGLAADVDFGDVASIASPIRDPRPATLRPSPAGAQVAASGTPVWSERPSPALQGLRRVIDPSLSPIEIPTE